MEETTSTNTEDVQSSAGGSAAPTATFDKIIELLSGTARPGMDNLIDWLVKEDFFEAPASTRFRGAYVGGLAEHSLRVCQLLTGYALNLDLGAVKSAGQKPLPIEKHTIVVAGLLHDVCKIGAYIPTPDGKSPYRWNKGQPKGHARLSIERIKEHIRLEPLEEMMILYHPGVWGLNEFYEEGSWQSGEYPLRGDHSTDETMTKEESKKARYGKSLANAYFHNTICFWFHVCDMLSAAEEKADGSKK